LIALGIADAFTGAGARVLRVSSLARALIAIEAEVPSAVILDHALSDGESSQLRECLKERNIPYVLHSGYSKLDGACSDAVQVPKPANPDVLVTTVLGLLQRRRPTTSASHSPSQSVEASASSHRRAGTGPRTGARVVRDDLRQTHVISWSVPRACFNRGSHVVERLLHDEPAQAGMVRGSICSIQWLMLR
jgi:DNA-binding NtrC family response regulator